MFTDLPTVEECQKFLALINKGRAVYGLDPVVALDYDACMPGIPEACLSATYLAVPAGGSVGSWAFCNISRADELAAAIGTECESRQEVTIPDAILRVTDPFDALDELTDDGERAERNNALRARLVEAGVVD